MAGEPETEFSFSVPADTVGTAQKKLRIVADKVARDGLARRFDLIAIDSFVADVTIDRIADGAMIRVTGSYSADIVQACVVSRQPVATRIADSISERLEPSGHGETDTDFDVGDEDPPLSYGGDSIELGELLAQYLAVAIDPYPRAADAVPEIEFEDAAVARRGSRPFQALAGLRKNRQ